MSWNIKTPGDYINGPLTVVGAAALQNDLSLSGNENYLYLFSNYSVGSNSRVRMRAVGAGGGSGYGGDFRISTRASNNTWNTDAFVFSNTGNFGIGALPGSSRLWVNGASILNTSNYIGASTWAATFEGNSNGAVSGISLLSYSAAGQPAPGSLHVVPVTDYRSGLVATYSADASGSGYFAINQFVPTSSSIVERLRVDRDGNVGINVVPSLSKSACLHLASGIAFPATQTASADANTLDDYEEGTFTPTIVGTSTAGTANYVVRLGSYTKVGRVVQFQIHLAWNTGTGTGNLRVSGLPFTANGTYVAVPNVYPIDISLVAGFYATASIQPSTDQLNIYQLPTGGGSDGTVAYDAAGQLIITGTYIV